MSGRTAWVVGNWKQHGLRREAADLAAGVAAHIGSGSGVQVAVAPPFTALDAVRAALGDASVHLFAQDAAAQDRGAHTGEVGPSMLAEAGATGAIVGHSERRHGLGETDELVARKLACCLQAGWWTILCVGEPLSVRETGTHEAYVLGQLEGSLALVAPPEAGRLLVAYEPVWAIGTGKTAAPEDAQAMHAAIRAWLERWGGPQAAGRSVLYGGSVKPQNAASLLAGPDVDGFLVGGASLDASAFAAIVQAVVRARSS